MSKLQSKQEEYAKNQRADIIYRVITNKPAKILNKIPFIINKVQLYPEINFKNALSLVKYI